LNALNFQQGGNALSGKANRSGKSSYFQVQEQEAAARQSKFSMARRVSAQQQPEAEYAVAEDPSEHEEISEPSTPRQYHAAPFSFKLPKQFGEFQFNLAGRKVVAMRKFKRLLPSLAGYEICDVVLILCNDISFLAIPESEERSLVLLHRPHARHLLMVQKAPPLYGINCFQLNFGGVNRFLLKAASAAELKFWAEKIGLYRRAKSRIEVSDVEHLKGLPSSSVTASPKDHLDARDRQPSYATALDQQSQFE